VTSISSCLDKASQAGIPLEIVVSFNSSRRTSLDLPAIQDQPQSKQLAISLPPQVAKDPKQALLKISWSDENADSFYGDNAMANKLTTQQSQPFSIEYTGEL
jgi:hypothetical protein